VDQPHGRCEPATQSGSMVDHEQCRQRAWRCLINAQHVSARARRSLPVVVEGGREMRRCQKGTHRRTRGGMMMVKSV
jgi:hypothetical protein